MKSTYKLLGIEWDHMPITITLPLFCREQHIDDYRIDKNLFDLIKYERIVRISEILSCKDLGEMYIICEKLFDCNSVHILLDLMPKTIGTVVNDFYWLRVLQIYTFMKNYLSTSTIFIMCDEESQFCCCRQWDKYVKNRHTNSQEVV